VPPTSKEHRNSNFLKEVLRQPLQTAVTINASDFDELSAQEQLHIKINVKDFRTIVAHAATLNTQFSASFSRAGRPLQFCYTSLGLECAFTLMTVGEGKSAAPAVGTGVPRNPMAPANKQPEPARLTQATLGNNGSSPRRTLEAHARTMPPPPVPVNRRALGRSKQPGSALSSQGIARPNLDPDSLFVTQHDDDQQWDPQNLDDGEMLGWDATASNVSAESVESRLNSLLAYQNNNVHPTFKDTASTARTQSFPAEDGLEPTQRISQVSRSRSTPCGMPLICTATGQGLVVTIPALCIFDFICHAKSEDSERRPNL
jgi:cell cycle checkpoint control protein RAD9A